MKLLNRNMLFQLCYTRKIYDVFSSLFTLIGYFSWMHMNLCFVAILTLLIDPVSNGFTALLLRGVYYIAFSGVGVAPI